MEKENVHVVELPEFTIYIDKEDNNLNDIIENESNKSMVKKEWDKSITSKLIFDLIASRISSEAILVEMADKNEELEKQNEYLLDKLNKEETFIEENRGKLE
ncbi:hypothetical protein [Staphylococcus saprophyticus]|uniref:hypothetical protein n=1 Tax=Staphylococcus saprophyticus TaxID=29385 RepID=UPI0024C3EF86|nr:hypothetical protein [Staphylococcus saprophyticus]